MVIDSSVILAILRNEPERWKFIELLDVTPVCVMSAASYLETTIVIDNRLQEQQAGEFEAIINEAAFRIEPVTKQQAEIARDAYRRFGKGNHPAKLNFGDCFAYALAKSLNQPLLFKGDDFSKTDIETVTV